MEMSGKVFVREATGLVRELTAIDAYIMSVSIISWGGAAAATVILLGLYPGSDLVLSFTLGLIPAIAFIFVYSILTAAFPRSGGDYVWVSRIAGPYVGFTFSWMLQFAYLFFICGVQAWFVAWIGLPSTLTALGLILKAPYLVDWSTAITSSANLSFLVCVVVLLLGGLVCILGVRIYSRIQRALWVYGIIGMAVWIGLMLTSTNASFVSSFNSVMGGTASYEGLVKAATEEGLLKPVTLGATLIAAIPLSWGMYAGFNYSIYMAGETKNVAKNVPVALVAGLFTSWLFLIGVFALSSSVFGTDFMYAMSSLAVAGSSSYTLPFGPSMSFLVAVLTSNPVLLFLALSSLIVWWFMILPPLYLAGSRVIFAWAYDSLIPVKLANVHERLHSPILAIVVVIIVNAFWAYMNAYQGFYLTVLNFSLLMALGWAIPGFTAALFPYVKKDLYERTVGVLPKTFLRRIAGVPVLTIAGLVQGLAMLFYGYSLLWPTLTFVELSPAVTNAVLWLAAIIIVGLVYLLVVRSYRKSRGLDLNMVFAEIPPE